ncbi:MAG: cyclic nucleotide-binding domain-containing protein [Deltaproteobacteria bacterium]|nr:cyclic nucleotide-binding domain-containing protein [Deltaproteobacteria bacterium]
MKEKMSALSETFLFKDVPEEKLEEVAKIAEEKLVIPGDVIIREGDFGDSIYVVVSGSVKIEKRVEGELKEIAELGRGEIFGEVSMVDEEPRLATVRPVEATTLLKMNIDDLEILFVDYPELTAPVFRALAKVLAARLRQTTKDMTFLRSMAGKN